MGKDFNNSEDLLNDIILNIVITPKKDIYGNDDPAHGVLFKKEKSYKLYINKRSYYESAINEFDIDNLLTSEYIFDNFIVE